MVIPQPVGDAQPQEDSVNYLQAIVRNDVQKEEEF
jgi:hypothetical protein